MALLSLFVCSYKARCRVLLRRSLAYTEKGRKNRSRDTKRAFQSLKTIQNKVSTILKKHLADFLRLKEKASKSGLGSFDLRLYRLVKGNGKTENYSILTRVLLKAGPRPTACDGSAARRPGGRRPTAHAEAQS